MRLAEMKLAVRAFTARRQFLLLVVKLTERTTSSTAATTTTPFQTSICHSLSRTLSKNSVWKLARCLHAMGYTRVAWLTLSQNPGPITFMGTPLTSIAMAFLTEQPSVLFLEPVQQLRPRTRCFETNSVGLLEARFSTISFFGLLVTKPRGHVNRAAQRHTRQLSRR